MNISQEILEAVAVIQMNMDYLSGGDVASADRALVLADMGVTTQRLADVAGRLRNVPASFAVGVSAGHDASGSRNFEATPGQRSTP